MFILILSKLFKRKKQIPEQFLRMVRTEYRSVPIGYVEYFYEKNNRLPTAEELTNAI